MQGKNLIKVVTAMVLVMFIAGCNHICDKPSGERHDRIQAAGMGGK